jgi:hypothetical protein
MVTTLIYAGVLREELLWLTKDDVELGPSAGCIRIRAKTIGGLAWQPKTRRNRAIPTSSDLRRELSAYVPPPSEHGWFFPSPQGQLWDPDNFSRSLRGQRSSEPQLDLPRVPPLVRQPSGDEGREPLQDRDPHGQLARDLSEALRGAVAGVVGGGGGVCENRFRPRCLRRSRGRPATTGSTVGFDPHRRPRPKVKTAASGRRPFLVYAIIGPPEARW